MAPTYKEPKAFSGSENLPKEWRFTRLPKDTVSDKRSVSVALPCATEALPEFLRSGYNTKNKPSFQ